MFKDFIGETLQAGDFIVYGYMSGRSPNLRFGKVLGIRQVKLKYQHYKYPSGFQPKLAVQGCDYRPGDSSRAVLISKSQLERNDGVFKIDRSQVPVEAQKLMDSVPLDKP